MIGMKTKTINFSAVSMVDVRDNVGTPVMLMNATINAKGELSTNSSVQNYELYNKYFDEVEKDCTEFRALVKSERDKIDFNKEGGD